MTTVSFRKYHQPCSFSLDFTSETTNAGTCMKPWPLECPNWPKELVPLKHRVKLRKSSQQMILPDIRKCSNLVQNMVANRYSCFWGLGAIWQPLWLKNSHNMAIFSIFWPFRSLFWLLWPHLCIKLAPSAPKPSSHIGLLMRYLFCHFQAPIQGSRGPKNGYFIAKSRPKG